LKAEEKKKWKATTPHYAFFLHRSVLRFQQGENMESLQVT
jgi:hypothetical protein